MLLGTYQCNTLSEIIVRLTFAVKCVTESVGHEILQFHQVLTVCLGTRALPMSLVDMTPVPDATQF